MSTSVAIGRGDSARPMPLVAISVTFSATIPEMPPMASIEPAETIRTDFDSIGSRSRTDPNELMLTPAAAEPVNDSPIG